MSKKSQGNEYMVGTCTSMCPSKEMLLREKENLLHRFEVKTGTENQKLPRADPDKVIKCYSRSAAGHKIVSSDLRPFPVLMKTIKYLYYNVFPLHSENPLLVYDFMFDRLRSIRQDMVIQNLTEVETISVLEPIARFHIYFGYILMEEDESKYDSFINNTHLQECLKRLLVCYDVCEDAKSDVIYVGNLAISDTYKNRCNIEGAYLLFNLPHFEALTRGAKLANTVLNRDLVKLCFAWYIRNYVRVFCLLKNLSPLMLCTIASFIPDIRKYSLWALSQGFSSSNSSYPLSHLKEMLLYENESQVVKDCNHFNIKVTGKNVNFLKKDFNTSAEVPKSTRLSWIDEQLVKCDLVQLLCYGCEQ